MIEGSVGVEPAPPPAPCPAPPPPEPRPLRITRVNGGFTVVADKAVSSARVKAAYEVRRGNPFTRYHPADFEFGKAPIAITTEDTEVIETKENRLTVGPLEEGSRFTVTGFDPARDLAVRVTVEDQ